ncbi:4-(cytidine 5'-diphospho)-2-C-methyl-D-erythritol kinase [Treponema sp.]|uniref:4-(cytidine 5'-diphospho)-2-C-methyl-D-erythritol kinase n=1 Tax=Treponema sp. TaxID=166 RepID=UPI003F0E2944
MSDSMTVFAPAKINLGLQIFPRRADGYHDLYSIFTTVSLFDELCVSKTDEKNLCTVEVSGMELPEQNTITAAYKAFCVLTGIDSGVHVSIKKRIPAGGGLGGGSSDASSFIQSVNNLFKAGLDIDSLSAIAEKVGSDVFFFTHALAADGGKRFDCFEPFAAVVEGRGEKVRQIQHRSDFSVLLIFPSVGVSTKEAYALVDKTLPLNGSRCVPSLEEIYYAPVGSWSFKNDFTAPVAKENAEIADALLRLKNCGADFVDMSGSGSTVFGIFEKKETALRAKILLEKDFKLALCLGD